MADLGKEFLNTIKKSDQKKTSAFDSVGTVTRVKDGVAYVHFAGGVDETPVKLTINAQAGDEVQVRVADGRAWLMGNATRPPTDDAQARRAINLGKQANDAAVKATKDAMVAHEAAESASADAKTAKEVAESVEGIAEQAQTDAGIAKTAADTAVSNLSQVQEVLEVVEWVAKHGTYTKATTFNPNATYYTVTATEVTEPSNADVDSHGVLIYYEEDDGIYVRTEDETVDDQKTYYRVTGTPVSEPKQEHLSQYYTLAVTEAMADYIQSHLMLTNDGLYVMKDGSKWKVLIADNGVYVLDPNGAPANSMTSNGNIIGINDVGRSRTEIKSSGMQILQKIQRTSGIAYDLQIADIGFGEAGTGQGTLDNYPYYTFGARPDWASNYNPNTKYAVGDLCMYDGVLYVCTTAIDTPEAWNANHWQYSVGAYSMAQGQRVVSAGWSSHAEGAGVAIRNLDHAEANGVAAGGLSHAEGTGIALGMHSHAQNRGTVAGHDSQTTIGKYNDNQSDTAFEVGNGDGRNRSNAFTVDWDGNVKAQGWAGFVQMFAGATAPSGWLFCDGSEVAVDDYPLLYAVIGNTYGTPSDSDHFVLPDFRGRTPLGAGQGTGLSNRTRGQKVGAETHKLTVNEMPSHRHKQVDTPWFQSNRVMSSGAYTLADVKTSNVYTEYTGGDQEHNNMQPSLGINFIICTGETS